MGHQHQRAECQPLRGLPYLTLCHWHSHLPAETRTHCGDRVDRLALAGVVLLHGDQPLPARVHHAVREPQLRVRVGDALRLRRGAVGADQLLVNLLIPAPEVAPGFQRGVGLSQGQVQDPAGTRGCHIYPGVDCGPMAQTKLSCEAASGTTKRRTICRPGRRARPRAHLKLDQYTAPSPTAVSPPPYSWTLVRALNPESLPGSTSAILPSGVLARREAHEATCCQKHARGLRGQVVRLRRVHVQHHRPVRHDCKNGG